MNAQLLGVGDYVNFFALIQANSESDWLPLNTSGIWSAKLHSILLVCLFFLLSLSVIVKFCKFCMHIFNMILLCSIWQVWSYSWDIVVRSNAVCHKVNCWSVLFHRLFINTISVSVSSVSCQLLTCLCLNNFLPFHLILLVFSCLCFCPSVSLHAVVQTSVSKLCW